MENSIECFFGFFWILNLLILPNYSLDFSDKNLNEKVLAVYLKLLSLIFSSKGNPAGNQKLKFTIEIDENQFSNSSSS